ncbi:MAG: hypothetical protein LBI38_05295 [Oscillospiraceae bacterium]|jgi:hypothetical protein|nr:hypothetical protein [Oscillospiraceae bacterium]
MTKDIRIYKDEINALLEKDAPDTDWEKLSFEMLAKIEFYQHERLVHLIVSMTVAVLAVMTVCVTFVVETPPLTLAALIGLFIVLVAPYMVYYFMLENAVQDIYKYYDKVRRKIGGKG